MPVSVGNIGTEMVLNGTAQGEIGGRIQEVNDMGVFRPYLDPETGRRVVDVNTGRYEWNDTLKMHLPITEKVDARDVPGVPVANATLTKDAWERLDSVIVRAVRHRLNAWNDLEASSNYTGFNGWATPVLLHQAVSDPGEALEDMDGLTEGRNFAPEFSLQGVPLPLTHIEFHFSKRELDISRLTNAPLDTVSAETAARRIAERIEKRLIGTVPGVSSHNYSTYGYTTLPQRMQKTNLTTPNGSNQTAIYEDVLEMVEQMHNGGFHGPYVLYHSTEYGQYLNKLFDTSEPTAGTLRQFIQNIDEIQKIQRLDYLSGGFKMILIQLDGSSVQAINGMPLQTIQYDSHGGMQVNFKIVGIMTQRFFYDHYENIGILHATTS